ncbi:MAG: 50S ribosomal protein L13 [Candidatus Yanofskybacteria bacterium CG10_big_fil_rev_8_21_14_0_10_36_16]|uniref:Large ribosomal subunit protein uL13 n=1 Tax=Candidatus Yanofskybacteria bacterium CG10_big_fil_rev_8_21_14_0_10_36_16 TaxID=1975096 RepID=A0A2J0Q7B1_9BACT|nr:MAG: 50S ribosomal protein L13 [Candidatus Yanofskybacteria bacterium CG10_big_fil_rev_8_21_14_0_10_36_16]
MEKRIDATNQSLGRLASKIAVLLRGKDSPDFQYNITPDVQVTVENVSKVKITGQKLDQKKYYRHSGYPGGIREINFGDMFEENPESLLKRVVYGMLPKNKLRAKIIKNLRFSK